MGLGGTIRGAFQKNYEVGTPVFKYELNGISLDRINTLHNLSDVTVTNPITFDFIILNLICQPNQMSIMMIEVIMLIS